MIKFELQAGRDYAPITNQEAAEKLLTMDTNLHFVVVSGNVNDAFFKFPIAMAFFGADDAAKCFSENAAILENLPNIRAEVLSGLGLTESDLSGKSMELDKKSGTLNWI